MQWEYFNTCEVDMFDYTYAYNVMQQVLFYHQENDGFVFSNQIGVFHANINYRFRFFALKFYH